MRRKFCLLSWSDSQGSLGVKWYHHDDSSARWSLLHPSPSQFVSSFDRANGLSIFQSCFVAVQLIDFSAKDSSLIDGFNVLGWWWGTVQVGLFLISENPRSRFMLELMLLLCRLWVLKRVARSQLLLLFNDGSDNTALLSWFLLKIRTVRKLDTIVCLGSLVWLFSPAWDAVKLILPGFWLHLSFRGHRPYRFRSDDWNLLQK